jgi:hypothetical protein
MRPWLRASVFDTSLSWHAWFAKAPGMLHLTACFSKPIEQQSMIDVQIRRFMSHCVEPAPVNGHRLLTWCTTSPIVAPHMEGA